MNHRFSLCISLIFRIFVKTHNYETHSDNSGYSPFGWNCRLAVRQIKSDPVSRRGCPRKNKNLYKNTSAKIAVSSVCSR